MQWVVKLDWHQTAIDHIQTQIICMIHRKYSDLSLWTVLNIPMFLLNNQANAIGFSILNLVAWDNMCWFVMNSNVA